MNIGVNLSQSPCTLYAQEEVLRIANAVPLKPIGHRPFATLLASQGIESLADLKEAIEACGVCVAVGLLVCLPDCGQL